MFRARVRCLTAVFLASSLRSDIGEEMPSLARDGDRVEQEGAGGIEAPGGGVGGVLRAWDVSSVYCFIAIFRTLEDVSENVVGGPIGAAPLPPPFDDSPVVPVDKHVVSFVGEREHADGE